jgi:hypothetical protein
MFQTLAAGKIEAHFSLHTPSQIRIFYDSSKGTKTKRRIPKHPATVSQILFANSIHSSIQTQMEWVP